MENILTDEGHVIQQRVPEYPVITDGEMMHDVLKEIMKNYGPTDTTENGLMNQELNCHLSFKWLNRDGVDSILDHQKSQLGYQYNGKIYDYYVLELFYTYSDSMQRKLPIKKSIY